MPLLKPQLMGQLEFVKWDWTIVVSGTAVLWACGKIRMRMRRMSGGNSKGKKISPNRKECVYCGAFKPETVDHVPPRSLFLRKAPQNLITVPCCSKCNQEFAKDDDYVRLVFTTMEGYWQPGSLTNCFPPLPDLPSGKNPNGFYRASTTLWTRAIISILRVSMWRSSRLALIDGGRLDTFAKRVVKALFYREKRYRLPPGLRRKYRALQEA